MPHMMDDFPLQMSTLYQRAVDTYPNQEIVSVEADRSIRRATYAETDGRVRLLAGALADELNTAGVPKQGRAFNLAWHDWLNLESQILVARAITRAALAREDSDRKSTRLNSSHMSESRMPSSA